MPKVCRFFFFFYQASIPPDLDIQLTCSTRSAALWPTETESTKLVQIGELDTQLYELIGGLSTMLNNGLSVVMGDLDSFIGFASSGAFCSDEAPSIPEQASGMDLALRTFLLSSAMKANGWGAGPKPTCTNIADLGVNPHCNARCTLDMNNQVCGSTWWSHTHNKAIRLTTIPEDTPQEDADGFWSWVESSTGVTLPALLDNAFTCTRDYGNPGGGDILNNEYEDVSSLVKINPADGTLDFSCMSRLTLTADCGWPCPVNFRDGQCPFPVIDGCPQMRGEIKQCGENLEGIPFFVGGVVPVNQYCT